MGKSKRKTSKKSESKLKEELLDKGIEVVSLSKVNQQPIISERIQRNKDWVYFGEDNLFPSKLIRLADNSALHSAILETKTRMIAGNGFVFSGDDADKAEQFILEAFGEDVDYLNKISTDVSYFDSFYLNLQYNRAGEIGTLKHIDYSFVRSGKMDVDTRKVPSYWVSTRWDIATRKIAYQNDDLIYKPVEILAFNPKQMRTPLSKKHGQLLVSKKYSPGQIFYALPSYQGALNYIDIAGKIASYHKAQLENGMVGNVHIHLRKDLSDTVQRRKLLQALNDQYAGSGNAGRIFLTWGTGDANEVTLNPVPDTGAHQSLSDLNDKVNQEIVSAHQIPREMAQLDVKTGLGGLNIRDAVEMFQNVSIQPKQRQISNTIQKILDFNGINAEVNIDPLQPATFLLSDEITKLSMTLNETREIANLPEWEDEEIGGKLLIEIENDSFTINTIDGESSSDTSEQGSES